MRAFRGPQIRIDHLVQLDDFLIARGWSLDDDDRDEGGHPMDPEALWRYPDSFGGVAFHQIDDVSPARLMCSFSFLEDLSIHVAAAGNYRGCPAHEAAEHYLAVDEEADLSLEPLNALLNELEPRARSLDARELIECRFFGPCGEINQFR